MRIKPIKKENSKFKQVERYYMLEDKMAYPYRNVSSLKAIHMFQASLIKILMDSLPRAR